MVNGGHGGPRELQKTPRDPREVPWWLW